LKIRAVCCLGFNRLIACKVTKDQKQLLREKYSLARKAISESDHKMWSEKCSERLCNYINALPKKPQLIAGYAPIQSELDIIPALSWLAGNRYNVSLPAIEEGKILKFHAWMPGEPVSKSVYGISVPTQKKEIQPDIIIVPLLAFNAAKHRLGYGGGYYDATLESMRVMHPSLLTIGVGFDIQQEPILPAEPHDAKLDIVITEKEVLI
jgi:5-formyltetrahydrofolate cyclo-ligase